jgi:hypothetical protein
MLTTTRRVAGISKERAPSAAVAGRATFSTVAVAKVVSSRLNWFVLISSSV